MSRRKRNEELLRRGVEAFNRGDHESIVVVLDPEIETHVAPGLGNSGTWHGIEGYETMVGGWGEAFESQENEIVALEFPDDDHVVAEIRVRGVGAGSGVPVEMRAFYLFEVRGDRAVRFHIYPDRESAMNAVR